MPVIKGPQGFQQPEALRNTHDVHVPKSMVITGEVKRASQVSNVINMLQQWTLYRYDSFFHEAGFQLKFLSLDGMLRNELMRARSEHPAKLAQGHGLQEGQATEALFVGNRRGGLKPESVLWMGRAVGLPHIEQVYYLDPSSNADSVLGGYSLERAGIRVIDDPLDVVRFVAKDGSSEIAYTQAIRLLERSNDLANGGKK